MTARRYRLTQPSIERVSTIVRAALPAASASAFDNELQAIMRGPVVDLPGLDDFFSSWWRIAMRANADPVDWL
jgi:hypothetical protein